MLDQNKINQFTQMAKARGFNDAQIAAEIARKKKELETQQQTVKQPVSNQPAVTTGGLDISEPGFEQPVAQPKPEEKTASGFFNNIFKSGWNTGKEIVKAGVNIFNPDMEKNTVANVARLGAGVVQKVIPGEQKQEKYANAVGQFYDKRYGISNLFKGDVEGFKKKVGNTIYEDPVGFALDASIILGGAGTAVKGVGTVAKSSKLATAGNILTKTGKAIDPLQAVSKIAGKAGVGSKVVKTGEVIEKGGRKAGLRAIKAAPTTDIANFQDDIGRALDTFQSKNKLYGSTDQILKKTADLITDNQNKYNGMVRTGQKVPITDYVSLLKKKAAEMKTGNVSPEVNATADALVAKAKAIEKLAGKQKMVAIDSIVDAKGASFNKINPATMRDAAALNADKIAGGIGIEYLDDFAPGSAEVGKELQALRAFEEIVKKRAGKGQGSQLFNIHKGGLAGAAVGGTFGGGVPGAIAGYVAGEAINSPRVLSGISQGTQKVGQVIQKAPGVVEKAGGVVKPLAVTSRATPNLEFANGQAAVPEGSGQPVVPPVSGADTSDQLPFEQPQPKKQTITGHTVEEHLQALSQATAAGDTAAVKAIKAQLDIEQEYQEETGGTEKPLSAPNAVLLNKANTALKSVDNISKSLIDENGKFQSGKLWAKKLNPLSQSGRQLGTDIVSAIDILGYFRTGAAITKEQRADYVYMFPSEFDDKATVEKKLKALQEEFEGYAKGISAAGGTVGLEDLVGGFSVK